MQIISTAEDPPPPKKGGLGYEAKLSSSGEAPVPELLGVWSTPSLSILLQSTLVVPVQVPSMGQIDPMENY